MNPTAVTTEAPVRKLTLSDRCDGCNAAAVAVVSKSDRRADSELMFCLHHYRVNGDALLEGGWTLTVDELDRYNDENRLVGTEN